jgi:hypothetical protein
VSQLLCLRRKLYLGHISIRLATTRSTAPVTRSPEATDEVIEGKITGFQPTLETAINTFFEDNTELPLWEPEVCSDAMRSHVAGLKIPKMSPLSQIPSLLLHDLGQLPRNSHLAQRVEKLFDPQYGRR